MTNEEKINMRAEMERQAIKDTLQKLKRERGLSVREFSHICEVSESSMSSWLNGKATPSLGTLTRLSDIFGVSPVDFYIPQPVTASAATLEGLTIEEWRRRALIAERREFMEENFRN